MYQQLVAKDLTSKLKLIDASQRLVDARTRLDTNLGEQQKFAEQIAGAEAERDGFVQEWQRKLSEDMAQNRSDRDATAARLSKAQDAPRPRGDDGARGRHRARNRASARPARYCARPRP